MIDDSWLKWLMFFYRTGLKGIGLKELMANVINVTMFHDLIWCQYRGNTFDWFNYECRGYPTAGQLQVWGLLQDIWKGKSKALQSILMLAASAKQQNRNTRQPFGILSHQQCLALGQSAICRCEANTQVASLATSCRKSTCSADERTERTLFPP